MINRIFAFYKENGQLKITFLGIKFKFKAPNINQLEDSCCIQNIKILKKLNTKFPHPVGIVIHPKVKIGKNCTIFQNVTIGAGDTLNDKDFPEIGNNVIIYPNTVICGNIKIGNNVIIGACSKVISNIEDNKIVSGNPAKILRNR